MSRVIPLNLYRFRKRLPAEEVKKPARREASSIRDPITDEILLPYDGMEDDLRRLALI